ncbi:MAG: DUF885 domain-containing protein [Chloroflexota bacterium]
MQPPLTPAAQFAALLHDEWEARLRYDPLSATYFGDHRYNDRLPSASEESHAAWLETLRQLQQRLERIDPAALGASDRLNYDIFRRLLENEILELQFHAYRLPISKTAGFHTDFPDQWLFVIPFENLHDYENYLARLAAFSRYVDEHIALMGVGLDTGFPPARVTLEGVDAAIRKQIADDPAHSPLYLPFTNFPAALRGADRQRLQAEGRAAIQKSVTPAYERLLRFFLDEYLPGASDHIGAGRLPDGRAFYQHRIRYFTSLDLSAGEVHATGQSEVARIRAEMQDVLRAVDFQGDFGAFIEFLRGDPRFYADTPAALLQQTAYLLKRIDGELPRLFKTLPRTPYGIREVPQASAPSSTTAYYFPPSGDGRTAGFYYVNTYDLPSRPLYEIEALSLHEAVPGHHLQIAMQQELDLPNFRRFGGFTAFVEGWALYAERLGLEMGFYQDPYSNFGRLSYEMWRACRLVVDTGMHALGWTRQQAIDFMAANTSSTLLNITNEIDRYIAWPGQALAYKIGELKIRQLRARAEETLGERFDIRAFHDVLIGSGAVPLDILEDMLERWIGAA